MKSKITKIQILKKGILLILMLAILLPSSIYAVEGLTLQESTTLEKLMYGEIGSVVKKIEEHFKSNTTLYIVNETQLRALAEYVNSGNSCQGKRIELLNDIKLNKDIDWMPIGNSYSEFSGTFYGNGYTISNLTYMNRENYETEGGYSNVGLFGVISKNGKVEKVNVNDSNITSNGLNSANINHVGNIAGTSYGIIKDCSANKMPLNKAQVNEGTSDNNYIGLLVGEKKAGTITTTTNQQPEVNFTVNSDTIKGDFKFYQKQGENFVEITDFVNTTYLKVNDTIRFEFTLDKYLYTGLEDGRTIKLANTVDDEGNVTEEIPKENYPMVSFAGVKATPIEVIQKEITLEDNTKKPQTKLVYEYTAIGEEEKESSSSNIAVNFTKNKDNENLYVYYSDDKVNFNTGDKIAQNVYIAGVSIKLDSKVPSIQTETYVEDSLANNRYAEGKEIIIKVTSSEQIQATKAPELKISFSESGLGKYNYQTDSSKGNAVHVDAILDGEGKTTWIYSYIIQPGDEGNLNVQYISGTIKDLCENETDITTLEVYTSDIYADTTAPTVEIIPVDVNNAITNKDTITYTFKFSEEVTDFTADDITVNNGIKGTLSDVTIEEGKYIYTIDITPNVSNGNVGNLQVIIEKDACQDLVGHGNVRTESIIRVDKKAPILLGLEAYAASDIALNKDIDIVKENYRIGEDITIIATFDENIVSLEENITGLPELALQFSESGNAKGTVSGRLEGNKIIYTYEIKSGDEGSLSVKGFTGTVVDTAGNETRVTKRVLDGDTIIADTIVPTLKELNVITSEGTYKANNTINIEAIYTEDVYALENNEIKNIVSTIAPTLKFKFGNGEEREAVAVGYGTKEDGTKDKSKVIYTCTVVDGDNGSLTITSYANKENVKVCDIAGNEAVLVKNQTGNEVIADTIRPQVTNITASVENPSITGTEIYHKEENTVKITLTFDEKVSGAVLWPTIQVGFSEIEGQEPDTYNDYAYESDWNVNSQTIEYSYTIKAGDNGYLWVKVPEGQFKDAAWNTNVAKEATQVSNVFADTTAPTITLLKDTSVDQSNQTITVKATFSEDVYDLNNNSRVTLTTTNAPKLIYSFGTGENREISASQISGAVITYVITKDPVNDNGTLHYELAKGNLCDRAGNEYYQETTDTTAPELESVYITTNSQYGVYCKKDTNMYITAVFNEEIANQNMKLKVKLGEGQEKELTGKVNEDNKKEVIFTYIVQENDNGELIIVDVTGNTKDDENLADKTYGYVRDAAGNQKNIFNLKGITVTGTAVADTTAPTLIITSDVERTNKEVVTYTFTWSETVTGFTASDIEVTNGLKGEFAVVPNTAGKVYTLKVDVLEEGRQIIKVNAGVCEDIAGNLNVERVTYNKVVIDYTKPVVRAKVNGGNYVLDNTDPENKKSTLKETIVVDEELSSLQYVWSSSETIPEAGWAQEDVSTILVNSDINLTKEVKETGTYYLYIKATDQAGNTLEAKTKAFVVKTSQIALMADKTEITNQDVTVTVKYGEGLTENRKAGVSGLTQSADSSKVIIKENGTVYAEATDKAGNKVCKVLEIENIDKVAPEGTITYVTNEDKSVTAKISFNEETIITNNDGKDTYVFTKNGEFTFEFKDLAENTGTAKAVVETIKEIEPDKTAPTITFNYTLTTTTIGNSIGATITTDENAIISYSWDNKNWTTSKEYIRSVNAINSPTKEGTYILYAKAEDEAGNISEVQTLEFTVIKAIDEIKSPEIIFEDLPTIQINGVKYVKISSQMTAENITSKMDKDALCEATPEYTKLTSDNKLKTGSEITINDETKYVIVVNGDVNGDGKVTFLEDIIMANNYRIGQIRLNTLQMLAADVNNSGDIEFIPDIVAMNNYRLGIINSL